jgi:DNA-binding MarR family transcriptional regulator
MSRGAPKRVDPSTDLNEEFRHLSTVTILFHQAIADRLGTHVTDHKCVDILLRRGPMTAGQLAAETGLTSGAITGVIDRLEKAGFARRVRDRGDRRRVIVEPIADRVLRRIGPLFEPLSRAMTEVSARYTRDELAVVRRFLSEAREVLEGEITRLRASS